MQPFLVADLNARGDLLMKEFYTYAALEQVPGASNIIAQASGALYRTPDEFEIGLDGSQMRMRWLAVSDTSGIATFRFGEHLASLSLLITGADSDADAITVGAYQRHLLSELRDTGYEAGFGLLGVAERPLLATINIWSPEDQRERMTLALTDRCLGAAYFRSRHLA